MQDTTKEEQVVPQRVLLHIVIGFSVGLDKWFLIQDVYLRTFLKAGNPLDGFEEGLFYALFAARL